MTPRGKAFAGPLVLAILDGWGERGETRGNAIANAALPVWTRILRDHPHTFISASGVEVGLPAGVMGNSEVGHINIGSGRVVPQGLVVINASLADGGFATNAVLQRAVEHANSHGGTLHLLGLLSDGSVHSSIAHLFGLIDAAVAAGIPFAIHAFGDGRDVPPRSLHVYVEALERKLASVGRTGAIASLTGRFYAMDRDKRWERTERAYRLLAEGSGAHAAATATEAVDAAYARGENDEFVLPTAIGEPRRVADGDAAIFFNFRPDRARQLTLAFIEDGFDAFAVRSYRDVLFATMTKYEDEFANPVLFGPRPQAETFGEIVARAGMTQLRLAETEKYAHVTYFFNGGREGTFAGEDRVLIPSDRSVRTYDEAPEMRASEIATAAIESIERHRHDVIVLNFANADMVGHTGVYDATVSSCETVDVCLHRLEAAVLAADGVLVITADHGNAEEMIDAAGGPITSHTTAPVPLVLASRRPLGTLAGGGKLGDVAPTLLPLLGLPTPREMDGRDLLTPAPVASGR